jgi:hypothetical protein
MVTLVSPEGEVTVASKLPAPPKEEAPSRTEIDFVDFCRMANAEAERQSRK